MLPNKAEPMMSTGQRQSARDAMRSTIKIMRNKADDLNHRADNYEGLLKMLPVDLADNSTADAALWELVVNYNRW